MDYKGDYFPEEEPVEMPPSKFGKTANKVFKYLLYGISAFIYLLLFWRIFGNCAPELLNERLFSDATNRLEFVTLHKVQSTEFMSYHGVVQTSENYYAEESKELAIGIKLNLKKTLCGDIEKLTFVLRDSVGAEYAVTAQKHQTVGDYAYFRVCFGNVELDLANNYYLREWKLGEDGTINRPNVKDYDVGKVFRLFIYEPDSEGNSVMLDDLKDFDYLDGKKELDEAGINIYSNITPVITEE